MSQQITSAASNRAAVETISRDAVEAVSEWLKESPTMRRRRLAAWEAYESIPMPTTRDEEWRRTDVRPLRLDDVIPFSLDRPSIASIESLPESLRAEIAGEDGRSGLLVQVNSSVAFGHLDEAVAKQGVVFGDLSKVMLERPDLVERLFMTEGVQPASDKFAALHAALWSGGSFLYVPRGVKVDLPIQGVFWADRERQGVFPHTLVVAEEGSEVTYIDQYLSAESRVRGGAQSLASSVVEVIARPGSRVRYISLQEWGGDVWSFASRRAIVERDASVSSLVVAFGGRLTKERVQTALIGPGANTEMLGFLYGNERQHFDYHTLQDHIAPNTTSDLLYKGALQDRARSVFSGMIKARKDAQKTDAVQTNRNLLLSNGSRADSIPNLEIEANDLRCTHAAAVAPVDEEQLFYLRARGLSRSVAVQLIVEGFFGPLLERIPLPGIQERLRVKVADKVSRIDDASGEA